LGVTQGTFFPRLLAYNVSDGGEIEMIRMVTRILTVALAIGAAIYAYAQDDAAALYKSKCQICHGADGKANTPAGLKVSAKDFHSPEVAKLSDAELITAVEKGKGKMGAYQDKLSGDQIKQLVKYLRSLK
jgi:mono/diheme cytochrome c family protein